MAHPGTRHRDGFRRGAQRRRPPRLLLRRGLLVAGSGESGRAVHPAGRREQPRQFLGAPEGDGRFQPRRRLPDIGLPAHGREEIRRRGREADPRLVHRRRDENEPEPALCPGHQGAVHRPGNRHHRHPPPDRGRAVPGAAPGGWMHQPGLPGRRRGLVLRILAMDVDARIRA